MQPDTSKERPSRKHKVMVVDDDESVRDSLVKLLDGEGYEVILAANGAEAVKIGRRTECRVDLLLVDLNMPLKNGWAALDQLREFNPSLPVFILTGLPHQSELAEAAGVSALVEKPIDVPGLLRLIQRQLAWPARFRIQSASHRAFPFCCLRAARDVLPGEWTEQYVAPYNHWGLNE